LEKRKKDNLGKTFVPNIKSQEFIKLVGLNKTFVNLFCAANGVGKTATCCNIVSNICFGPQNEYFKYPLFKDFPYLKKGRIISDPTTIKEKIVPELKKWFPSNRYDIRYSTKKESKPYEAKWTTDTGFEFDLMSNEQAAKEFESTDLGWSYLDEPSRQDIYMATVARMRTGGIIFWGMTPLSYSAWIKDKIYDKRDGKIIDYVTATVWDNCKDIEGTRGILTRENIERMISQYPEDERLARVEGEFGHLLGLVHKGFEPKIHVIDPFPIDRKNFTVIMHLDTHPRVPDACLWVAVDEKGTKYVIDELNITGVDEEIVSEIRKREHNYHIRKRLIDPSGFNTDKRTSEVSFATRLSRLGMYFEPGSKNLQECIRRTDKAFKYELRGDKLIVEPELYIFSTCMNLIRELQNYVWDEYQGKAAESKEKRGQPKDINDHMVEGLHRILIDEPKHVFRERVKPDESFDRFSII